MTNISKAIDSGIEKVIWDFREHPQYYFTEEDVRWRLMREIENALIAQEAQNVEFLGGITSAVHAEYPTPFRCLMTQRSFSLLPKDSKGQRGHFDVVVLNPLSVAKCEFEIIRSQDYQLFLDRLPELPLPLLECVIEIKLFRDLAHPNRTESVKQQAEYAIQAIDKVAATLKATQYYSKPFANRGLVLLFDNSDLVSPGDAELARNQFLEAFRKSARWSELPDTLSCIWVTPQNRRDYRGEQVST